MQSGLQVQRLGPSKPHAAVRTACVARKPMQVRAAANPVAGEKFDYIIVGGGTAGCVLANKLSAKGDRKVLVLEAGPPGDTLETMLPIALTRLFQHPMLDWNLFSSTQKPLNTREIYLARGKCTGGSSCTNATLYLRGSPADYDAWGLEGWSSKDVLDWFIKSEKYQNGPKAYHGTDGTMSVEQPRFQNGLFEQFFKACEAAGLPANPDFNNWSRPQAGYGEFQVTQKWGRRADANRMYLKPALTRGNLKVLTNTRTTKLHFDKSRSSEQPRVTGVQCTQAISSFGERFDVELAPGGEVLMCSGTVHTPHILQLSGVGGGAELREHGIDVVADLPGVGKNLQDHPATLYSAQFKEEFDPVTASYEMWDKNCNFKPGAILKYLFLGTGPFATTACDRGAFVATKGSGEPDLQIRFVAGLARHPDAIQNYIWLGKLKERGEAWPPGITMQLLAVRPKARGSVSLNSTDPFQKPSVDLGWLKDSDSEDLATLRRGVHLARRIAGQTPLSQYLKEELNPGPNVDDESDIDEWIRRSACSGNALVGTCKMGPASDKSAVVSHTDLKVHGIDGLRVIDASVMPRIPGGQTGAATVMIAERAAAMLTGQHKIGGEAAKPAGKELVAA